MNHSINIFFTIISFFLHSVKRIFLFIHSKPLFCSLIVKLGFLFSLFTHFTIQIFICLFFILLSFFVEKSLLFIKIRVMIYPYSCAHYNFLSTFCNFFYQLNCYCASKRVFPAFAIISLELYIIFIKSFQRRII